MISSIRAIAPRRLASTAAIARSLARFTSVRQVGQPITPLVIRNAQPTYRTFVTTTLLRQQAAEQASESGAAPAPPVNSGLPTKFAQLRELGVHESIVSVITNKMQYEDMTEVQSKTIPVCMTGIDVIARAKTGTGKTLAFLIPTVNRLVAAGVKTTNSKPRWNEGHKSNADPRILIISPTRELAEQIARDAINLTRDTGLQVACMVGGTGKAWSIRDFHSRGCNILIGTPGRLKDVLSDPNTGVNAEKIETLIFDEADSLMDMGFEKDIEAIKSYLPKEKQTLMFSATMPDKVRELIGGTMRRGFKYINTIDPKSAETHTKVPQHMISVGNFENTFTTLFELMDRENRIAQDKGVPFKAMVFFNTARAAEWAAMMFRRVRLPGRESHPLYPLDLIQIHSRLSQPRRTEAADHFRNSESAVLFSSDVTARGMDFPNVTHVIQVGAPNNREQYIHRIGRTARGKNIESGNSVGYLILSDLDSKIVLKELRGINLLTGTNKDLVTPEADLTNLDSLDERAGEYARAIANASSRIDGGTKLYQALIGAYMSRGADVQDLLEGLFRMTKYNLGWENPPSLGRTFGMKLGFGANYDWALRKGYLTSTPESEETGRAGGSSFSTRRMGMNQSGPYNGPRETSYGRTGPPRQGGYNSNRQGGGYGGNRQGGGYANNRQGGSYGNNRQGGGYGNNRQGGSGGYGNNRQGGGRPYEQRERREPSV
ncbi:hypothetical protein TWF694_004553 [Orbilia ellipsospora]|uniref:ATP-dependent RNA helicase n=1 Tax=Orbilia ellipsospora TaxID=2528407 RepID=A0AAV9WVL2_9PEZI